MNYFVFDYEYYCCRHDESGSNTDYVAKLYLETLWLPEVVNIHDFHV